MRPLALAALTALALAGCDAATFEPSGENYNDDVAPPTTGVALDFGEAGDTLLVWGDVELAYALDPGEGPLLATGLFAGEEPLEAEVGDSTVTFDSRQLDDGYHTVQLVARAGTGTGSLADVLGAETLVASGTRTLLVENAPAEPVAFTNVETVGGRVRVSWEPNERVTFAAYDLYRTHNPSGTQRRVARIEAPDSTSWEDRDYVGGEPVSYQVVVVLANGSAAGGESVRFEEEGTRLGEVELTDAFGVRVTWSPSPFYANATYRVERADAGGFPGEASWTPVHETSADTSHVDRPPFRFGDRYQYRVRTLPGIVGALDTGSREVELGYQAPFHSPLYLQGTGAIVAKVGGAAIVRVDPVTFEVVEGPRGVDAYRAAPFASPSGHRLFTAAGSRIREHDPETLAPFRAIDLEPLFGENAAAADGAATDGGLVFFSKAYRPNPNAVTPGRGVAVLDIETGAVQAELEAPLRLRSVSPDGRYLNVEDYSTRTGEGLYEFGPSGLSRIGDALPEDGAFIAPDRYLAYAPAVTVYSVPDRAVVTQHPLALAGPPTYDPLTGLYAGVADGPTPELVAFDLQTGTVRARLPLASSYPPTLVAGAAWLGDLYYRLDL